MHTIENVECFKNCTKLCKPHESNKMVWEIHENYHNLEKEKLLEKKEEIASAIKHPEFI